MKMAQKLRVRFQELMNRLFWSREQSFEFFQEVCVSLSSGSTTVDGV